MIDRIIRCDACGGTRFNPFHPIPYPIPCRGALGFWRVPESSAWHLHPQIPEDWQ